MSVGPQLPPTWEKAEEWERRHAGEQKRWWSSTKQPPQPLRTKEDYEKWRKDNWRVKYVWEFMRRSPEYLKDFKRIQELFHKAGYDPDNPDQPPESPEHLVEVDDILAKYHLKVLLFDPELSFNELAGWEPEFDEKGNVISHGKKFWGHSFVRFCMKRPAAVGFRWTFNEEEHVTIKIDFSKINSIGSLKKYLSHLIDEHSIRLPKKSRLNETDYETILTIGDLRYKQKLKPEEIARKIYPDIETAKDLDSGISKVKQHCKKYEEFINGRYRDFIFP